MDNKNILVISCLNKPLYKLLPELVEKNVVVPNNQVVPIVTMVLPTHALDTPPTEENKPNINLIKNTISLYPIDICIIDSAILDDSPDVIKTLRTLFHGSIIVVATTDTIKSGIPFIEAGANDFILFNELTRDNIDKVVARCRANVNFDKIMKDAKITLSILVDNPANSVNSNSPNNPVK